MDKIDAKFREYRSIFQHIKAEFLHPCVTIDDTWIHRLTPETREVQMSNRQAMSEGKTFVCSQVVEVPVCS